MKPLSKIREKHNPIKSVVYDRDNQENMLERCESRATFIYCSEGEKRLEIMIGE